MFAMVVLSWSLAPALSAQQVDTEGWMAIKTAHFSILTDAGVDRGLEIAHGLERFWEVFARISPELVLRSPAPTKIFAFRDAESYGPYKTASGGGRVLGQFLSHPDSNYLTLDAGTQLVGSMTVAQHEFVHYLVRHNFPSAPLWFNEGLAEYYSTFTSDGERIQVGIPVERHLRWLKKQGELDLGALLETDRHSASHAPDQVGSFYAGSWALVHYLLSGSTERLLQTADFFLHLEEGMEGRKAFELAYDLRLSTVEEELQSYLDRGELPQATMEVDRLAVSSRISARPAAPADVLYHLGDLVLHMGRIPAAESHFHRALGHDPEHAATHGGLALARDFHQRFDEASILYQDAVALRSREPITYLARGRHQLTRTQGLRGEAAAPLANAARVSLETALELFPDYGEALVLLGMSHQVAGGEPLEGARALARARKLLPHRPELIVEEVRLYAMGGEADRGEALIERVLVPRGAFELEDQARAALERHRLLYAANQAFEAEELERGLEFFDEAISATRDPQQRREMEEQFEVLRRQIEGE